MCIDNRPFIVNCMLYPSFSFFHGFTKKLVLVYRPGILVWVSREADSESRSWVLFFWKVTPGNFRRTIGKGREQNQCRMCSWAGRLLVRASGAQSHWGALGDNTKPMESCHAWGTKKSWFLFISLYLSFVVGCSWKYLLPNTSGLSASISHG